jgi:hypothetical protein
MKWLWRLLRGLLLGLAAIVILLEEWGWQPLTRWAAKLAQWPPIKRLEARLVKLNPQHALLLFLAPTLLLFPIKVLALWLIHQGKSSLGIALIVAAKLLGTAMIGRLFILTESQLNQIPWFARALGGWRHTKQRVLQAVRSSSAARTIHQLRAQCARWFGPR